MRVMCTSRVLLAYALIPTLGLAGVIYDLRTDWSLASNPNGAWSYNQAGSALPYAQLDWGGVTGETFWTTTLSGTVPPAWARVATAGAYSGPGHWEIGDVIGHSTTRPGPVADVTWTSPAAGTISISGRAWDAYHAIGRDDRWRLFVGGELVAGRDSVLGLAMSDAAALFANNLLPTMALSGWSVQPGDTVVFEIEEVLGVGHFVGVDLTIDLEETPAEIPEPVQTLPVLAALAAGVWTTVARRNRLR